MIQSKVVVPENVIYLVGNYIWSQGTDFFSAYNPSLLHESGCKQSFLNECGVFRRALSLFQDATCSDLGYCVSLKQAIAVIPFFKADS